jgi:uncharacterized membrane protein YbhN (UPF0104 family)
VTAWGLYGFLTGDHTEALAHWRSRLGILPLIALLACLDVAIEGVAWIWTYDRMGIRSRDSGGVLAYLSGRAGLLLPAQLGRLVRPDAMARMKRGTMAACLKPEAAVFVLDATSVVALIAGLATAMVAPIAAPFVAFAVIVVALLAGNVAGRVAAGTRMALPPEFWLSWKTFATVLVQMFGWAVHGLALYLVIRALGTVTLGDTILYACGASVLGAGSGLPGGIGATEGLLGMSLSIMAVPAAYLAIAIGAFRLLTFWIWLPVGWLALATIGRRVAWQERTAPVVVTPAE